MRTVPFILNGKPCITLYEKEAHVKLDHYSPHFPWPLTIDKWKTGDRHFPDDLDAVIKNVLREFAEATLEQGSTPR